jgi:hypothetical protein
MELPNRWMVHIVELYYYPLAKDAVELAAKVPDLVSAERRIARLSRHVDYASGQNTRHHDRTPWWMKGNSHLT